MVSQSERSYNQHHSSYGIHGSFGPLTLRGGAGAGNGGHGASSVISSSATARPSRSKRYSRSHAGGEGSGAGRPTGSSASVIGGSTRGGSVGAGAGYALQNEFPIFGVSGDVEIIIRVGGGVSRSGGGGSGSGGGSAGGGQHTPVYERRYLLHRHTLTRCSGFFEASTSQEWSRAKETTVPLSLVAAGGSGSGEGESSGLALIAGSELARHSSEDGQRPGPSSEIMRLPGTPRKMWRYELDPATGDGDVPMLVQRDPDEDRSPPSGAAEGSLFGPGSGDAGRLGRLKPGQGNHSFFRSVANLSLVPASSSHGNSRRHNRHQRFDSDSLASAQLDPADAELLRDYDNLFRIFYNYAPILDTVNIADAYVQCKSLLTLADQYDALAVVGPRVDHHLLQFQSRLWKQIAKYPISYLRLGYLARSRVIFQEALVHVVGQWPAGERSLRAALPDAVLDVIEDKVDELEEAVARVEARLFRLGLTTARGERVTPQTAYLDWLAVSLFRQWLADNTCPPPSLSAGAPLPPLLLMAPPPQSSAPPGSSRPAGPQRQASRRSFDSGSSTGGDNPHHPPPPRQHNHQLQHQPQSQPPVSSSTGPSALAALGRAYRTLGSPNPAAYLGHDECKRFLKLSPDLYSRDNLRRLEKRLDDIKAAARELVRPLMASSLELDVGTGQAIGYLTCTVVTDRDLPWDD